MLTRQPQISTLTELHIQLRRVGLVKSEELPANEILASGEDARDRGCIFECVEDIGVAPYTLADGTRLQTSLCDPMRRLARVEKTRGYR